MERTTLLPPVNGVCLLVVEESLADLSNTLEFLSAAFGAAKSLYPTVSSLLPVYGPEYEYILDTKLEIHDIKIFQGN
jgi:hypothetical protein